ncbi:MAG TPA: hypothetical protein VNL38_00525 [Candidatus Nitrosotenuis sp.]|nr:hypothetical protein [Candidatus Nitrosotenuis sp.]
MAPNIQIPEPPEILPAAMQAQWKKTYAEAFEQAQADDPDEPDRQRMIARREANRVLRTPKCASADDVRKLADWQVVYRGEVDGVLKCVTIDGKKYAFPVGRGAHTTAAQEEKKQEEKKS